MAPEQAVPPDSAQAPQLAASVWVSEHPEAQHEFAQHVPAQLNWLPGQVQMPEVQLAPAGQTVVQLPQELALLWRLRQVPLQQVSPAAQPAVGEQAWQVATLPVPTQYGVAPLHFAPVEPQTQALPLQMFADVPQSLAATQVTQEPEPSQTPEPPPARVQAVPLAALLTPQVLLVQVRAWQVVLAPQSLAATQATQVPLPSQTPEPPPASVQAVVLPG